MRGCKCCAEKDRLIESLQDQVEWMRLQAGTPLLKPRKKLVETPEEEMLAALDQPWQDELTEDLEHMARQQILSKQELEEALRHVGAMNTTIEMEL